MLTSRIPTDWRDLQESVARILTECGFTVEVEKVIPTVRGNVEIDVFARELIDGRTYTVLCECKHWAARVPQNVIHGFRTVVADSGANLGYIISMAGFQSGALTAAELTNIRLVTWIEFQEEFEASWLKHHLVPTVTNRLDELFDCTEPLFPTRFYNLPDESKHVFLQIQKRYWFFGTMMFTYFTSYARMTTKRPLPSLPMRLALAPADAKELIPDDVLDSVGYSDFLNAALAHGEAAIAEFRKVLGTDRE
jgi:restriction system protein